MNLKFYKLRTNAKLPVRAHRTDAGMDLFYCPNGNRGACTEDNGEYWIPS
jgi:dUTPase